MPALRDDDPNKWNYDFHTDIKHQILRKYLSPWVTVLGSSAHSLAYIDGFAGRGRYNKGQIGSPLVAIEAANASLRSRKSRVQSVVCHFVEENPSNFANLNAAINSERAHLDSRIKIRLYESRFSLIAQDLIRELDRGKQPAFVFVDPFGYDDPPMELLDRFLALDRVELLINLMFNFINRAMGSRQPTLEATIDRLVGTPDWRRLTHLSGRTREFEFVQLYRQQLRNRGATLVTPFRMGDDDVDRTLYYLVHATKHLHGTRIMKNCMASVSSPGELGYGGVRRYAMQPLFDLETLELPIFLMQRFQGLTKTFDEVLVLSLDEAGRCTEKDYRDCLKRMEQEREVTVTRVTSQRKNALSGKDQIEFHGRRRLL